MNQEKIGMFIQNYDYSEIFSKKVLNNLDKWHIEMVYLLNGKYTTESINLTNEKLWIIMKR